MLICVGAGWVGTLAAPEAGHGIAVTGNACAIPWHPQLAEGRQAPGSSRVTGNACAMPWHPQLAEGRQAPGSSRVTGNACASSGTRIQVPRRRLNGPIRGTNLPVRTNVRDSVRPGDPYSPVVDRRVPVGPSRSRGKDRTVGPRHAAGSTSQVGTIGAESSKHIPRHRPTGVPQLIETIHRAWRSFREVQPPATMPDFFRTVEYRGRACPSESGLPDEGRGL
jgi:hypothetical protein